MRRNLTVDFVSHPPIFRAFYIFFYKYQPFTNIKLDNYSHCLPRVDITMQFDSIKVKYAGGAITRDSLLRISARYRA